MKKIITFFGILGVFAFASDFSHTDIIPRSINFIIYVAILWYLVGNKAINFFKERREKIAKKFSEIEDKLKESKLRKEALKAELENAKLKAKEIIENAKLETEIINKKIKQQTEAEIEILQKQFEEFKEMEHNKIKKEVVKEFLDKVLDEIHISSDDAVKLILKVA